MYAFGNLYFSDNIKGFLILIIGYSNIGVIQGLSLTNQNTKLLVNLCNRLGPVGFKIRNFKRVCEVISDKSKNNYHFDSLWYQNVDR